MPLERTTRLLDTDVLVAAGRGLGLEVEVLDAERNFVRISRDGRELYIKDHVTSMTNAALRHVTDDRYLTLTLLRRRDLPAPESAAFLVRDRGAVLEYAEAHRPVVVTPNARTRLRAVTVKPADREEIETAVARVERAGYRELVVEAFLYGTAYQALVHDGEVIDCLAAVQPVVVGDGEHSVADLVALRNNHRRGRRLPAVEIDAEQLEVQGVADWEILPPGYPCRISRLAGTEAGAEMSRVPLAAVAPENLALFRAAADACYLPLASVGFISMDISRPYTENGAAVFEVDSCPHAHLHYFADMAEDLTAPAALLSRYFGL